MNTMELVRFVDRAQPRPQRRTPAPLFYAELAGPTRQAILRARQRLISEQLGDGSWAGTQTSDASLPSQLIFLLTFLDEDPATAKQAANAILRTQLSNGGWSRTSDGEADLNVSVQAYLALKLTGTRANDACLRRARTSILAMGGADAADATTRRYLALFAQITYDICPPALPEALLAGRRADPIAAALALIWAHRPVHQVEFSRGVRELFVKKPQLWPLATECRQSGRRQRAKRIAARIFGATVRLCERRGWLPLRSRALNAAEARVTETLSETSIRDLSFSDLAWQAIAIRAVGLPAHDNIASRCRQRIESMIHVDELLNEAVPLVRTSPLSDTLAALQSLAASGLNPSHRSMKFGAKYLARSRRQRSQLPPTAFAQLLRLISNPANLKVADSATLPPQIEVDPFGSGQRTATTNKLLDHSRQLTGALVSQLIARQSRNGSWDSIEQTGAILEAIASANCNSAQPAIARAIRFLRTAQHADGRWSDQPTSDILATAAAACGLATAGLSSNDDAIAAGLNWLAAQQQSTGGWSHHDSATPSNANDETDEESPHMTASIARTAAALFAFVAAGQANHPAALRAVSFLLDSQADDGGWRGLDFPLHDEATGQWCRNDLHAVTSPLLALSRWTVAAASAQSEMAESMTLHLVGAPADN
jgi:squalene-hopene/tetraprenyl-beta-curcumene cyclase